MPSTWPGRTPSLVQNHHQDSRVWLDFELRQGDVVVATYGKAGTTLSQQLLGQLLSKGDPNHNAQAHSPWLDLRFTPPEAIQGLRDMPSPRIIKTHLPASALPYSPVAKYLVVCRDMRDVAMSLHNHFMEMTDEFLNLINNTPGRVGPELHVPNDPREFVTHFLRNDGEPFWAMWENMRSWWEARHLPNVLLVHFNNLRADKEAEGRRIASFLGWEIAEDAWPRIVEHCSMDFMRAHAAQTVPAGGAAWKHGASSFVFKGTNGRWKDLLTAKESAEYEATAVKELGPECAHWLMTGEPIDTKTVA